MRKVRAADVRRWLRDRRTWALAAGVALVVGLFAAQLRLVGDWRVDDAYITYSFAKNLGAGKGPIYSHDVRVEGYSNFLWMAALAVCYAVRPAMKFHPTARTIAGASVGALFWATYRLTRLRAGAAWGVLAVALLACSTDLARATTSGLETAPYAALLAIAALAYLREAPGARRYSLFWFVAVALTRIDGCVPLAFVLAFELASSLAERRFDARAFARWAAPALALYGAYFAWRWWYYGLPLPATYYAKSMVAAGEPDRGATYVWNGLRDSGLLVAVPFAAFGFARRPSREALFLGSYAAAHAAYVAHVGGDWMPFNRFLLPALPFVAVPFAWGLAEAWAAAAALPRPGRALAALALAAPYGFAAVHLDARWVDSPPEAAKLADAAHVADHTKNNLLRAAPLLRHITRRPGETLVTDYAGVFALYTEASVIDMWGLCNAKIAREGGTQGINPIYGKTCPACYGEWKPDYFHANIPILRAAGAFKSHAEVIGQVFQAAQIERHLDLRRGYATGRVLREATSEAVFFLERRREGVRLERREVAPGVVVDYPFEPAAP